MSLLRSDARRRRRRAVRREFSVKNVQALRSKLEAITDAPMEAMLERSPGG